MQKVKNNVISDLNDEENVKWKGYDNSFNSQIDKKRYCYIKISYFPPYGLSKNKIEVKFDFSNYHTKSKLKKQQPSIHRNVLKNMI